MFSHTLQCVDFTAMNLNPLAKDFEFKYATLQLYKKCVCTQRVLA